ncbi:hypothetical protein H8959_009490 [Pygathrix nigripes]
MNRFGTRLVGATATSSPPPKARSNENLDKIDMSLDDIIKLNRKEGKKQNFPRLNRRLLQQSGARQFRMRELISSIRDKMEKTVPEIIEEYDVCGKKFMNTYTNYGTQLRLSYELRRSAQIIRITVLSSAYHTNDGTQLSLPYDLRDFSKSDLNGVGLKVKPDGNVLS